MRLERMETRQRAQNQSVSCTHAQVLTLAERKPSSECPHSLRGAAADRAAGPCVHTAGKVVEQGGSSLCFTPTWSHDSNLLGYMCLRKSTRCHVNPPAYDYLTDMADKVRLPASHWDGPGSTEHNNGWVSKRYVAGAA
jgi:hypothetical protein